MLILGIEVSSPYNVTIQATLNAVDVTYHVDLSSLTEAPYKVKVILDNGTLTGEELLQNSIK